MKTTATLKDYLKNAELRPIDATVIMLSGEFPSKQNENGAQDEWGTGVYTE